MFRLETERLLIRPWEPGDRPAFTVMATDPEVMRYLRGGKPFSEAEIDEFMARQERQLANFGVCMGALVEKSTGNVVGVAGTQPLGGTADYEIGWWLMRDKWGRGYATEAGAVAMQHVFDVVGKPRAVAIIDPGNEPSVAVVKRLGMVYDRRYTGEELKHRLPHIVVDLFYRDRDRRS